MSGDLRAPEPLKSRLLLEMAADLESMAEHFRREGMTEREAVAAAEERLLASPKALDALVRVHTSGWDGLATRMAWALRSGLDRLMFIFGLSPLLIAAVYAVSAQIGRGGIGIGSWAMLGAGVVVLGLAARSMWLLRFRGYERRRVRESSFDVLYLGGLTGVMGAAAFTVGLFRIFDRLSRPGSEVDVAGVAAELTRTATVFAVALLVALAGAMTWFLLANRLTRMEQAESAALLAD